MGGELLFFNVSGLLYRNNLVLVDDRTGSLWPQILGNAANGSYHGSSLVLHTSSRTTWGEWKSRYPESRLLARPLLPVCFPNGVCIDPGFSYDVDPYEARYDYYNNASTFQPRRYPDDWMHPKTFVLGLVRQGEAKAYTYPDLAREGVVNDIVGGEPIVVAFADPSAKVFLRGSRIFAVGPNGTIVDDSGKVYDSLTGRGTDDSLVEIPAFWGFWFAWKDVHPETCVYRIGCPTEANELVLPFLVATGVAGGFAIVYRIWWRRRRPPSNGLTRQPRMGKV